MPHQSGSSPSMRGSEMRHPPKLPEIGALKWEKEFLRYEEKGGYHWTLNSSHPLRGNAFVRARFANVLELAEKSVGGQLTGKLVLDHGCGDGVLANMLARKNAHVFGVDNSEVALRYAQTRITGSNVHFQSGSVYELPYRDDTFDSVISTQVIEHLAEPVRLLTEIRRILKKGGRAVITTRIRLTEKPIDPTHVGEWFEDEFKSLIEGVFPGAEYFKSHPAAWMEASFRFKSIKLLANILSLVKNPFAGFDSGYRLHVIQYALTTK